MDQLLHHFFDHIAVVHRTTTTRAGINAISIYTRYSTNRANYTGHPSTHNPFCHYALLGCHGHDNDFDFVLDDFRWIDCERASNDDDRCDFQSDGVHTNDFVNATESRSAIGYATGSECDYENGSESGYGSDPIEENQNDCKNDCLASPLAYRSIPKP